VGQVTCTKDMRNAYNILVGKSEGKTPFGNIGTELRIILERISKDKL